MGLQRYPGLWLLNVGQFFTATHDLFNLNRCGGSVNFNIRKKKKIHLEITIL